VLSRFLPSLSYLTMHTVHQALSFKYNTGVFGVLYDHDVVLMCIGRSSLSCQLFYKRQVPRAVLPHNSTLPPYSTSAFELRTRRKVPIPFHIQRRQTLSHITSSMVPFTSKCKSRGCEAEMHVFISCARPNRPDYGLVWIYHPDSVVTRHYLTEMSRARFQVISKAYDILWGKASSSGEPIEATRKVDLIGS
jgi:hypothetical protein